MIPTHPDLKQLREDAGLKQSDLAKRLKVTPSQVLRYEAEPENVPLRVLREWLAACGAAVAGRGLDAGAPFDPVAERIVQLERFARSQPGLEAGDTIAPPIGIEDLLTALGEIGRKPRVVLAGRFDAGKSRLANTLIGADRLPTAYRPTTRIVCLLRHISEKPEWQREDVWIMADAGEAANERFDLDRFDDRGHCEKHRLLAGDFETLARVGTHPKDGTRSSTSRHKLGEPVAAVVYVDAPILRSCDIVDTPGFEHDERDTTLALNVLRQAVHVSGDVLVYLSPLTGFLNGEDLRALGALLEALPTAHEFPPLRQVAVLATHVHHNVDDDEVADALSAGAERAARELAPVLRRVARSFRIDAATLRSRFFPWYVEIPARRTPFENDLKQLLGELRPAIVNARIDNTVAEFKGQADEALGREVSRLETLIHERDEADQQLRAVRKAEPERRKRMEEQQRRIEAQIAQAKAETAEFLVSKIAPLFEEDRIRSLIEDRYEDAKEAEQHAANAVMGIAVAQIEQFVGDRARQLASDVDGFLGEYAGVSNLQKLGALAVPFDAKGAFLGSLAGTTTFGALAAWVAATTSSNLGAYILVAKAAGLLSSLGISFAGGAAGATALVAAIGGPVTIGIALATAVGLAIWHIFGRSWQSRLASKIAEDLVTQKVLESQRQALDALWDQTLAAFKKAAGETENKFADYLNRLEGSLVTPRDLIEARLGRVTTRRSFLSFIPWQPFGGGAER